MMNALMMPIVNWVIALKDPVSKAVEKTPVREVKSVTLTAERVSSHLVVLILSVQKALIVMKRCARQDVG
jgi:hypothetical protein